MSLVIQSSIIWTLNYRDPRLSELHGFLGVHLHLSEQIVLLLIQRGSDNRGHTTVVIRSDPPLISEDVEGKIDPCNEVDTPLVKSYQYLFLKETLTR